MTVKHFKNFNEMMNAGYEITAYKYKFEEYGVPQKRHRIVIVGIKSSLGKKFMSSTLQSKMTAGEALANIPVDLSHQELTKQSPQVVARSSHIKKLVKMPGMQIFLMI